MSSRKLYFTLVIVGGIVAITGIFMMRAVDPSLHTPGKILGWGGIALLLIARIFFAIRRPQPPPSPKS